MKNQEIEDCKLSGVNPGKCSYIRQSILTRVQRLIQQRQDLNFRSLSFLYVFSCRLSSLFKVKTDNFVFFLSFWEYFFRQLRESG